MKYHILIYVLLFFIIGVAGCAPAAPSSILSETSAVTSSQPKYVLSAKDAAKIEEYSKLPDSDEEIIAAYHYQFDLYDYLKTSLAEHGYSEKQIAQIDRQDYEILTKDWPINPNDPNGRTFGDLEEEARENEAEFLRERAPTPEQQAWLDELGIDDELLLKLLTKEYFDRVENLLAQPEERIIELRDLYKSNMMVGEAFQNWRQMIRARYFEITGREPFIKTE